MAEQPQQDEPRSFGNISDAHWSRARRELNQEALEYYRRRSQAPGVAEGGAERNFYCMQCDGVIPHTPARTSCPHCGAALDETVRRYFNWVEMNDPPRSDLRALLPILLGALLIVGLLVWLVLTLVARHAG